jgi:hypothetical protein
VWWWSVFATSAEIHAVIVIVAAHYSVVQIVVVRALKKSLALVEAWCSLFWAESTCSGEAHRLRLLAVSLTQQWIWLSDSKAHWPFIQSC